MARAAVRLVGSLILAIVCGASLEGRRSDDVAVTYALALYEQGEYIQFREVVGGLDVGGPGLLHVFEKEARTWVMAVALPARPRRRLVAASAALELAHLIRDRAPEYPGAYLVWASQMMREAPPPVHSEPELWWSLACVAGMQELNDPWLFTTGRSGGTLAVMDMVRTLGPGGQLAIATRQFPEEPRFHLARAVAREAPVRLAELSRSYAGLVGQDTARLLGAPQPQQGRYGGLDIPALDQFEALPDIHREFLALADVPGLAAEVALHLGYLESVATRWDEALGHLRQVPTLTDETYLRYLSDYFIGRVFQKRGDRAAALEAFERAASIIPRAGSASTQFAGELLVRNNPGDRDRAFMLLQSAYIDGAPEDPWQLYWHGDARLWPLYMARLRQSLR